MEQEVTPERKGDIKEITKCTEERKISDNSLELMNAELKEKSVMLVKDKQLEEDKITETENITNLEVESAIEKDIELKNGSEEQLLIMQTNEKEQQMSDTQKSFSENKPYSLEFGQKTDANLLEAITENTTTTTKTTVLTRYSELTDAAHEVKSDEMPVDHQIIRQAQLEEQRINYEKQLEQLQAALLQKENMISLFQRENAILEKEKQAFRKEKDFANKEKEDTVIKFAIKEKLLLDAKKEKDAVEKQLAEAKKEIKNISIRFHAVNEEKSRITYIMDEKCNELRKYQRECEKVKTDYGHLESKLKYHVNKLNMELEAKAALEKKLEEERNAPNKLEEKANERLKVEFEANTILLKHELERKTEMLDNLNKENHRANELVKQLQEQLNKEKTEKTQFANDLALLQEDHNTVQNAYSEEMLQSAKLRGQLDELQLLRTQNTLNDEKIADLNGIVKELEEKLQDNAQDLKQLHVREVELLSINKEMSESIVSLQSEICLLKAKAQGIEAENEIMKKEKCVYDEKYAALEKELNDETLKKNEERQLLAKHLSEKTKLYETTKMKLENILGDFEATKTKQATVVKELQREIQKYKKVLEQNHAGEASASTKYLCSNCQSVFNGYTIADDVTKQGPPHSRNSSQSGGVSTSRRASESSESETVVSSSNTIALQNDLQGPSKKHLVERILRLQQASARQTEKIDFLENHTLSLVAELQKKSKVVQYYMLRDQAGALTSSKSDQNKTELAKYGNGVMSAIYNGIKGENKSMTLELSLEINKKLQAVLEDTLLKNITLKENLDVLGMEVETKSRKLRQLEMKE